jgi:hypothetical protein
MTKTISSSTNGWWRMKAEQPGSRLAGPSHRRTTQLLRRLCLAMVLAGTVSAAQERPPAPRTIVVPRDASTIQAAVEAVPHGGTVVVRPGRYEETVWVRQKTVQLVGVDRPMVVGPIPERVIAPEEVVGLVNYADGGGGSIRGFNFVGGESAIAGFDRSAPPGALTVRDSHIQRSGRGILCTTGPLNVKDVVITGTLWHGISLLHTPTIHLDSISLAHGLGIGIVQVDTACDCNDQDCIVEHTFVNNYLNGGILALRSGLCVSQTTLADNGVFGLEGIGSAIRLIGFAVIGTKKRFDGAFGDGIVVRPYALPSVSASPPAMSMGPRARGSSTWEARPRSRTRSSSATPLIWRARRFRRTITGQGCPRAVSRFRFPIPAASLVDARSQSGRASPSPSGSRLRSL